MPPRHQAAVPAAAVGHPPPSPTSRPPSLHDPSPASDTRHLTDHSRIGTGRCRLPKAPAAAGQGSGGAGQRRGRAAAGQGSGGAGQRRGGAAAGRGSGGTGCPTRRACPATTQLTGCRTARWLAGAGGRRVRCSRAGRRRRGVAGGRGPGRERPYGAKPVDPSTLRTSAAPTRRPCPGPGAQASIAGSNPIPSSPHSWPAPAGSRSTSPASTTGPPYVRNISTCCG